MASIIDGKRLAADIRQEIAAEVARLRHSIGVHPQLATILVGENPASEVYVRNKVKFCHEVGIQSQSHQLGSTATEKELLSLIETLNKDEQVDGILLQLPLPSHLDKIRALDSISPAKDVDGLHPLNAGLVMQGRAELIACTPLGVMEALKRYQIRVAGKKAVVIGRSDLVGKPLAMLLMHENATVTICHSKTKNLKETVLDADLVIAAMGTPAAITGDMIHERAVIIDVGTTVLRSEQEIEKIFGSGSKKLEDFRNKKTVLVGDVHPAAYEKSFMYTPVPGGIGPLTIAMLLRNTLHASKIRKSQSAIRNLQFPIHNSQ